MPVNRPTSSGMAYLDIAGVPAGRLASAEGGEAYADVVTEKIGPDMIAHKHLAGVKYEPIQMTFGLGMEPTFYDLVKATLETNRIVRKDGSLKYSDFDGNVLRQMDFFHALVVEIGFPAADAKEKSVGHINLTVQPESTRVLKPTSRVPVSITHVSPKQWLTSNFRLTIPGLDCTRVSRVESLTIKREVAQNAVGEMRDYERVASSVIVPDLVVSVSAAAVKDFEDWHHDFVVLGKNDAAQEKKGTLEFLTADMKSTIFTLTLYGLGIYRLAPAKSDSAVDSIQEMVASMYCEQIRFDYNKAIV